MMYAGAIPRPQVDENRLAARDIVDILLRWKRPVPFSAILQEPAFQRWDQGTLSNFLNDFLDYFVLHNDRRNVTVELAPKNLQICALHCAKDKTCPGHLPYCSGLHICKFYILSSSCKFKNCHFGHDITTAHNTHVLASNLLEGCSPDDVRFVLKQCVPREGVVVPKICSFYNHNRGCRFDESGKKCSCLHICKHYVQGSCSFGPKCKRNHDIMTEDIRKLLEGHGIATNRTPKEILQELREAINVEDDDHSSVSSESERAIPMRLGKLHIQKNPVQGPFSPPKLPTLATVSSPPKFSAAAFSPPSPSKGTPSTTSRSVQPDLVCMYHLQGRCSFGQNCRNTHHSQPYQWMFRESGQSQWEIVDDVEGAGIEMTYSDANNSEHILTCGDLLLKVKFVDSDTMPANDHRSGRKYQVRRISTVSSAEVGRQPLATDYKWYWENPAGQWVEYGHSVAGYQATILSCDIEDSYISNPDGQREFTTQGHKYILDFVKMVQKNVLYGTERAVARRPVFVNPKEVDKRRKQKATQPAAGVSGPDAVKAPPHWNVTDADLIRHCHTVKLSRKSPSTQREFSEIERAFCDTMPSTVSIKCIERIENGDLWLNYVTKRTRMEKKCPGKLINDRRLYHGTKDSLVEPICKQGFDFRLSGTSTGTMYGKGSYFAMSASKAAQYTSDNVMFVVRVLVGDYVKGNHTYVRPPAKDKTDPASDLYDSCVDNVDDPKIFVIFDNNGQVHPEYIIKYEMRY